MRSCARTRRCERAKRKGRRTWGCASRGGHRGTTGVPATGFGCSDEGRGGGDMESVDEAVEEVAGHLAAVVDLVWRWRWKRRCSASASSSFPACSVPSTASWLDASAIDEFEWLDAGGGVKQLVLVSNRVKYLWQIF